MSRLIVVSNRVALPHDEDKAGGLGAALQEALAQGEGLWRIGQRAFVVRHVCTPGELDLFDTTARMIAQ